MCAVDSIRQTELPGQLTLKSTFSYKPLMELGSSVTHKMK